MGDECQDPKNHVAIVRAANQINGSDIFTEAERIKNFNSNQRAHYERMMVNYFGIGPKSKNTSVLSALPKVTENGSKPNAFGRNHERFWSRPSEIFSKRFYGDINAKFESWSRKGGDLGKYQEMVGKPARAVLAAIDKTLKEAGGNKGLINRGLKPLGLTADTVYDARRYLDWVAKGGHTQTGDLASINRLGSNVAKAQANFQLMWTLGNGADMIRVYSHYLTRKGSSVMDVMRGTLDAMQATQGNPFRRIPELEKAGVYSSDYMDRGGKNNTPFELSITAQKNLTYYLDRAAGGDGMKGIRDQLFDSKPWDRPFYDRNPDTQLIWGLARYPINETRWLFHTSKAALGGDQREMANLLVFAMGRAYFLGMTSLIPAPIYMGLSKDDKKAVKSTDERMGLNMAKIASRKILGSIGINAEVDMSQYTQPLGGTIGARAKSITDTAASVGKYGTRGVTALAKGNFPAAAAHGMATTSAIANLTAWPKALKLLGGINSTTVTKLFETAAKSFEGEFKRAEQGGREVVKDLLGAQNVRKAKQE